MWFLKTNRIYFYKLCWNINKVIVWTTGELAKHVYMMYIKVWWRKYVLADVGQESQPWSFVLSTGHVQGLFITWMWLLVSSPKCFCSIFPRNTHTVCFDTYSIVIVLTSGHAADWINTSVSCLVKLPLWFLLTLTLVSLVLWESIKTPTSLQLSILVDRHGVFMKESLFSTLYSEHC